MTPASSFEPPELPEPTPDPKFSRRRLLRMLVRGGIGACVLGASGLTYAHEIEPSWLHINRLDIAIKGLPGGFEGLSIAHLSDIHMDPWMTHERVKRVCETANGLTADLIVLTGDFITRDERLRDAQGRPQGDAQTQIAPGLPDALSVLQAPLGVWGVLGNHDHWASGAAVSRFIREGGVRELNNKITPIERNGARLWLCGVDDLWSGKPDYEGVLAQLQQQSRPDETAILLVHEPDFADIVAGNGRISLQLSGHSHGGQVNIPFFGPPVLPAMGRKYHTGLYQIPTSSASPQSPARSSMQVFTSRGIGVAGPRVRFNCPPEIALLTLRCA